MAEIKFLKMETGREEEEEVGDDGGDNGGEESVGLVLLRAVADVDVDVDDVVMTEGNFLPRIDETKPSLGDCDCDC